MSFDNHYPNRKDRRREYHGSRAVDRSCRPHCGCPWCRNSRRNAERKAAIDFAEQLREISE